MFVLFFDERVFLLTRSWVGGRMLLVGKVAVGGEVSNPYLNAGLISIACFWPWEALIPVRWRVGFCLSEPLLFFFLCGMDKANKGLVSWKGAVSSWQAIDRKNRGCFHSMALLHNRRHTCTRTLEVTPNLCKSMNKTDFMYNFFYLGHRNYI